MNKVLLIQGDESVKKWEVERDTGAEVEAIEGSYGNISSLSNRGTYDAIVWSGHGGYDGPRFENQKTIASLVNGKNGLEIRLSEHYQPSSVTQRQYSASVKQELSPSGCGKGAPEEDPLSGVVAQLQSSAEMISAFNERFNVQLALGEQVEVDAYEASRFFFEQDASSSYENLNGKEALHELNPLADQLGQATESDGFIYFGSCNNGSSREDGYNFAQQVAEQTTRTVFAAPNTTSAPATLTNISRIMNRSSDKSACDVKLQDNVHCF